VLNIQTHVNNCRFRWVFDSLTTRETAWYIISRASPSLCIGSLFCLSDDNFRKPSRRKFIFAHPVYLQGIRIKFVYEGHRVKVKVTGAKKRSQMPVRALINFDRRQFSSVLAIWRHRRRLAGGHALDCVVCFSLPCLVISSSANKYSERLVSATRRVEC